MIRRWSAPVQIAAGMPFHPALAADGAGAIYAASADTNRFGDLPITIGLVQTTAPGIGGNDTIGHENYCHCREAATD